MLTAIAIIGALLLVGAALVQGAFAIVFKRWFLKQQPVVLQKNQQELAAVIMSVRGCDPSLRGSLAGILNQQYEDYQVHLVVDHRTDLAWNFVHDIKSEFDKRDLLTIHEMCEPSETCSLKCHAIVQALEKVPEQARFIAFLDADVTPHPTWLAELTGPLVDPSVGGVTGNQWFEPERPAGPGSLTRSLWNGGALVPTIYFSNPWAGSFAMRSEDMDASGLRKIWSRSVVDDGPIHKAINGIGLRIVFAPSLIMVNKEPCTISYVNRWVTRMLTWSRLYEKTFFLSIIHAVFSNFVMLLNFAILVVALSAGHQLAIGASLLALVASGLLSTFAFVLTRRCVARSCQLRGDYLPPLGIGRFMSVLFLIAVAHIVYGVSCARAAMLKKIKWREIIYEVRRHDNIRRMNYQPYAAPDTDSEYSI